MAQDAKILVKLIMKELKNKPDIPLQDFKAKAIPNQSVFGSYSFPAKMQSESDLLQNPKF